MDSEGFMVSVLLSWVYISLTSLGVGGLVLYLFEKIIDIKLDKISHILLTGLVFSTVYAQFYSIFSGVSKFANILLILFAFLGFLLYRERIFSLIQNLYKQHKFRMVLLVFLIAIWSYFSSRGYIHYDSDLYHAQSIRWIEEYGVVKGLGNFHERFAYNSSFFSLSALYSMNWLIGKSLHTLSGYFALLLSIECIPIVSVFFNPKTFFKEKRMQASHFAQIAAIYYLTTIVDEIASPASDYPAMLVIFLLVIIWLDNPCDRNRHELLNRRCLLCMLGVFSMTIKLTSGLILLLVLVPVITLIRQKKFPQIVFFSVLGFLIALPWFIRTVLISGYLLYPFVSLDLFSFDWKMNRETIIYDAANIKTWGRALYNAELVNLPISKWFKGWFRTTLSTTEKGLILLDFLGLIFFTLNCIQLCIRKSWERLKDYPVYLTIMASYLFWQLSAPLIRYGYAYVLLLASFFAGEVYSLFKRDGLLRSFLLLYGCYKLLAVSLIGYRERMEPYYLCQKDYGVYDLQSYIIDDETFYYPLSGDQTGYAVFPAAPGPVSMELRGTSLKDGFRYKPVQ